MRYLSLIMMAALLASCGSRPRVESGHPYTHHERHGGETPKPGDIIHYHLRQRSGGGGWVYSSYQDGSPKRFRIPTAADGAAAQSAISPLTEAMLLMSEGDSLTLEIDPQHLPPQLRGNQNGKSTFFDIKLLDIRTPKEIAAEQEAWRQKGRIIEQKMPHWRQQYQKGKLQHARAFAGVTYIILEKGKGQPLGKGAAAKIHFSGFLLENGGKYADTCSKGSPIHLPVGKGRSIPAWESLLPQCRKGDEILMFVPAEKAYGAAGNAALGIPEKADLAIWVGVLE